MKNLDLNLPVLEQQRLYAAHLESVQSLVRHPGWGLFQEFLLDEERRALTVLAAAQTGDLSMKAAGAYTMIKRVQSIADEYIRNTREYLEGLSKK